MQNMNYNSGSYNYNLLPQWQQFTSIETSISYLILLLSAQKQKSLQCGSGKINKPNEERLWIDLSNLLIDAYGRHYEAFPLENNSSLYTWKIDQLASNPYASLCSWLQAFKKMLTMENIVSQEEFYTFHQSTLYLLCTCIPFSVQHPSFNPSKVKQHLYHAFIQTSRAFLALKEVYPPIIKNDGGSGSSAAATIEFTVYDPYLGQKHKWYFACTDVVKGMKDVFKHHLKENNLPVHENDLNDLVITLSTLFEKSAKASYLLPFICTKLFAEYMHYVLSLSDEDIAQGDAVSINEFAFDELYSYETFVRLFDQHQSKVHDASIFFADERTHPVIAFMQDAAHEIYKYGRSKPELFEDDVMTQINTNWLALALYGSRRFFADSQICSHYCDLTLPILLRHLYGCEDNTLTLSTTWLPSLAEVPHLAFGSVATIKDLNELCDNTLRKLEKHHDSDEWKNQLAAFIFAPELWDSSALNAPLSDSPILVQIINQLIADVAALLRERKEDPEDASDTVRLSCIQYLFDPIRDALQQYLEWLSKPEKQWIIFWDLISVDKLIRRDIDSFSDENI